MFYLRKTQCFHDSMVSLGEYRRQHNVVKNTASAVRPGGVALGELCDLPELHCPRL